MSITTRVAAAEDPHAERWRRWQSGNAKSSRRSAMRVRIAFTVVLTGAAVWLGLQLLPSSVWP